MLNYKMTQEIISSEDLMIRAGAGDRGAFEILVKRHERSILNFIFRFVGDRRTAEDLAQDVFLRVWQAGGRYRAEGKFTTWAFRIAANLSINEVKSARRRKWFSFFSDETNRENEKESGESRHPSLSCPSPEECLLAAERSAQVIAALQSLPHDQRMAVILKRFEGLSYGEIAVIMGRSESAVDALLVRAKRNLRKLLLPLK
jgi:RNA polymerase sigma-70 factor (ECF subfamily)